MCASASTPPNRSTAASTTATAASGSDRSAAHRERRRRAGRPGASSRWVTATFQPSVDEAVEDGPPPPARHAGEHRGPVAHGYSSIGRRRRRSWAVVDRLVVARVGMPRDADPRVVRQHARRAARPSRRCRRRRRPARRGSSCRSRRRRRGAPTPTTRPTRSRGARSGSASRRWRRSRRCIASVSRNGEATEPVSRWSRPITIGAETSPRRTRSLKSRPALARSP